MRTDIIAVADEWSEYRSRIIHLASISGIPIRRKEAASIADKDAGLEDEEDDDNQP